jgi:hypothetical protein
MTAAAAETTQAFSPDDPVHRSEDPPPDADTDFDATSEVVVGLVVTARKASFPGPDDVKRYVRELLRTSASTHIGNIVRVELQKDGATI